MLLFRQDSGLVRYKNFNDDIYNLLNIALRELLYINFIFFLESMIMTFALAFIFAGQFSVYEHD